MRFYTLHFALKHNLFVLMKIIKRFVVFERNIKLKCCIIGSNNNILIDTTPHGKLGSKEMGLIFSAMEYNSPEKDDPPPALCGTNN